MKYIYLQSGAILHSYLVIWHSRQRGLSISVHPGQDIPLTFSCAPCPERHTLRVDETVLCLLHSFCTAPTDQTLQLLDFPFNRPIIKVADYMGC